VPDILALGEPLLEFNQRPGGDPPLYLKGHGGDTSNAAIAAARSGASVGYITGIGADAFGEDFLALWRAEGVDTATVRIDAAAHTGIYFVTHTAKGHAFTYFRAGSAASRMAPATMPEVAIRAAKVLHLSGISQAISGSAADAGFHAMAAARAAGVRVSYDTNLRLRLWAIERARAVIHAAIAMADIALPSLDDAVALTGLEKPDAIADFYLRLGAPLVALKLGKDGVLLTDAHARHRIAPHQVQAVDATGAGDTFAGAFLARLVAGDAPHDAAIYANAAAALATTGYGAVAPIPREAAVRALLARSGFSRSPG
jgi:2-dehydro-3-deoxygluconokinase